MQQVKENVKQLFTDLIEFYGEQHQCLMCIEEMSELTKELIKYERGIDNYEHIAEEVADVYITLAQVVQIYDIEDSVDAWGKEKLTRTAERLQADKA